MLQWYSQEKVDELTKRKDAQGQYQIDAEFPTDKNERYYYVRTRLANIKSAEQELENTLEGEQQVDKEGAAMLLSAEGLFGTQLALPGHDGSAEYFAIAPAPKAKPETKTTKSAAKAKGAFTLEPADFEVATSMINDMLSQVSRAERLATELNAHQLSTDIEKQMTQHAQRVKQLWKIGEKLVGTEVAKFQADKFVKIQEKYVEWTSWFDLRYDAGQTLAKKIDKKRKVAAKAEADKKKAAEEAPSSSSSSSSYLAICLVIRPLGPKIA